LTPTSSRIFFASFCAASFARGLMANFIASLRFLTLRSLLYIGSGPAPALCIILPASYEPTNPVRKGSKLTPEPLVTKEGNDDSRTAFSQANSGCSCSAMMYDSRHTFVVEQPVMRNVSKHEYVGRNRRTTESTLAKESASRNEKNNSNYPASRDQSPNTRLLCCIENNFCWCSAEVLES